MPIPLKDERSRPAEPGVTNPVGQGADEQPRPLRHSAARWTHKSRVICDQLKPFGGAVKQEFDHLQKRVAEAQRNLDLAIQKRDQAAVDDALDKDRVLNVAFAAKPSASSIPVQPRPFLYLALGLFTALFLPSVLVHWASWGEDGPFASRCRCA